WRRRARHRRSGALASTEPSGEAAGNPEAIRHPGDQLRAPLEVRADAKRACQHRLPVGPEGPAAGQGGYEGVLRVPDLVLQPVRVEIEREGDVLPQPAD